eukprot:4829972-Pyramimonas_sp.AAC.1
MTPLLLVLWVPAVCVAPLPQPCLTARRCDDWVMPQVGPRELLTLAESEILGETVYVKQGTVIAKQGTPCEHAYIIARGQRIWGGSTHLGADGTPPGACHVCGRWAPQAASPLDVFT